MQNKSICFEGQNFYIGIDVHYRSWNVTILSDDLHIKTFNQPPEAAALRSFLDSNFPGGQFYSAYEIGFCGFTPHYDLIKQGINNIVFNPADISDTKKERSRKTDSTDSRKIARNLRNKELSAIYIPTVQEMADRNLVRTRSTLVKEITRTKVRIKAFLKYYGITTSKDVVNQKWSEAFIVWIKESIDVLPVAARTSILVLLDLLDHLHKEKLKVSRQIKEVMMTDKNKESYNLILTVPGVGFALASLLIAEICNINRFETTDMFASFLGLVPDTRSSGEKDLPTGLTNRCNGTLRAMLIESSWIAIRNDPALLSAYSKLVKRMAPNKAIIRIARKLANRIYCVLKTKKPYVCSVVK